MASRKIKTQLFLMLLIYNNITTAENMIQSESVIQNHTHNVETKADKNLNETFRLTKFQDTLHDLKNEDNLEHKLNHTIGSVKEDFLKLEYDTNTSNFPNITLEKENTSLLQKEMKNINKSISTTVTSIPRMVEIKENKSVLQNGNNNINKNISTEASLPGMVEMKEKSNTSARKSKILPFFSDVIIASNSRMENNEGLGNFRDLDLNKLSIENLQKLNTFTKISEYASFFGLDIFEEDYENIYINSANGTNIIDEVPASFSLASSLGRADRTLEAYNSDNDIVSGVFASCQPELQTVILDEPLGTMYLPGCVRLRRCGGCCVGNLLECRPTKTEPVKIKVLKINQKTTKSIMSHSISSRGRGHGRGRGRMPRSSRRPQSRKRAKLHIVNEWQHAACACQCRVQPHHCHPNLQDYNPNECSCVCKNRSEEKLCYTHSSSHFWERSSCSCKCKRTLKCSTGEFFNAHSCRCSKALEEMS